MTTFKQLFENKIEIDAEYWNTIHVSPQFRKINRMKKHDLINELGKALWKQNGKVNRIMDEQKVIAAEGWSQREMAYLLYTIEWNRAKVPV
jgi:hypothetical protein